MALPQVMHARRLSMMESAMMSILAIGLLVLLMVISVMAVLVIGTMKRK